MTTLDETMIYAKDIYRVWRRLPVVIRRPISSIFQFFNLRVRLLHWLVPNPQASGFLTLVPQTPPAISKCLQRISQVGPLGDYYEFGLYRGYTFWYAQRAADRLGLKHKRFFGFDSFKGLPKPEGVDTVEFGNFHKGDYACSREQVEQYLNEYGVDWSRTCLIEGYYSQSLQPQLKTKFKMHAVSVALIDCDLYHSTVEVLRFLDDLLQDGSILMFDDWNCFNKSNQHGQRLAFREFLNDRPLWRAEPFIKFGWHGQSFILRQAKTHNKAVT